MNLYFVLVHSDNFLLILVFSTLLFTFTVNIGAINIIINATERVIETAAANLSLHSSGNNKYNY